MRKQRAIRRVVPSSEGGEIVGWLQTRACNAKGPRIIDSETLFLLNKTVHNEVSQDVRRVKQLHALPTFSTPRLFHNFHKMTQQAPFRRNNHLNQRDVAFPRPTKPCLFADTILHPHLPKKRFCPIVFTDP